MCFWGGRVLGRVMGLMVRGPHEIGPRSAPRPREGALWAAALMKARVQNPSPFHPSSSIAAGCETGVPRPCAGR